MKIINLSNSDFRQLCNSAFFLETLIKKALGLIILNDFKTFDGVIIKNCKIIHSFFMKFSFDAVFLDSEYNVIAMYSEFKPNRVSKYVKRAQYVLELPKGVIKKSKIKLYDKLEVKKS